MVAVWEGKDGALFETGRIGADKKKQKKQEILSKRETQKFSCVNLSALIGQRNKAASSEQTAGEDKFSPMNKTAFVVVYLGDKWEEN